MGSTGSLGVHFQSWGAEKVSLPDSGILMGFCSAIPVQYFEKYFHLFIALPLILSRKKKIIGCGTHSISLTYFLMEKAKTKSLNSNVSSKIGYTSLFFLPV